MIDVVLGHLKRGLMSPKRKNKRKENNKKKKNQINKKNNKTRYGIRGLIQRNPEHSPKGLSKPNA